MEDITNERILTKSNLAGDMSVLNHNSLDLSLSVKNSEVDIRKQLFVVKAERDDLKKDLKQAALYGQQLVEKNALLSRQLDACKREKESQVEKYEQECHRKRLDFENLQKRHQLLVNELESNKSEMREMLNRQEKNKTKEEDLKHSCEILRLRAEKFEREVQQLQDDNKILQQKFDLLQDRLSETRKANDRILTVEPPGEDSETLLALQIECESERSRRMKAEAETLVVRKEVQRLQSAEKMLALELKKTCEHLEEKQKEHMTLENLLDERKMEVLGLESQLSAERLTTSDPEQRGNSLFGEVEDRRQKAEVELKSLEGKYATLKKQFSAQQQQHTMLKARFAALLSSAASTESDDYITDLEERLATALEEQRLQTQKVNELESQLKSFRVEPGLNADTGKHVAFISDRALEALLNQEREENAKLRQELHSLRLTAVSRDEENRTLNRDLRRAKQTADKKIADCVNLKLKAEELELQLKEVNGMEEIQRKTKTEAVNRERISLFPTEETGEPKIVLREKHISSLGKENLPGALPFNHPAASGSSSFRVSSFGKPALSQKKSVKIAEDSQETIKMAQEDHVSVKESDADTTSSLERKRGEVDIIRVGAEDPGQCLQQ